MLPARHRMRRGSDFELAVRRGRRSGRPTVTCHLWVPLAAVSAPESGGAVATLPSRRAADAVLVGFVVSRAVGNAVVRNRVKRRLRAAMAQRLTALPPGSRLVLRAGSPASSAPAARLAADVEHVLARLVARGVTR